MLCLTVADAKRIGCATHVWRNARRNAGVEIGLLIRVSASLHKLIVSRRKLLLAKLLLHPARAKQGLNALKGGLLTLQAKLTKAVSALLRSANSLLLLLIILADRLLISLLLETGKDLLVCKRLLTHKGCARNARPIAAIRALLNSAGSQISLLLGVLLLHHALR